MFKSLWTLIRLQLSEKLRWKPNATTPQKVAAIAIRIGFMGVAFGIFTALFYLVFNVLFLLPSIDLFIFFIFILQLVSIITCTVQSISVLYTSKDNALLLTYPVKHIYVFISKIICMYILEFLRSTVLVFPLFMAYATIVPGLMSASYVLSAILFAIIVPLIPVLLGAIISIPFVYITKIFKKAVWVKGALTIILLGGLITVTVLIVRFLSANAPIRIAALWNKFNVGLIDFCHKANRFALYCNFIGKSMYSSNASGALINDALVLATLVGVGVVSILISLPCFFRLASSASENATAKKHKGENKVHTSTFFTFIRKELTISLRNIGNFASDYVFLVAMPFVIIILTSIFINIDRSEMGYSMTYSFICLLTLVMLCASNTASATAISSEGNEFVLLKTAPGKTSNIIWSKLVINFIISFIFMLLSFVAMICILKPDIDKGTLDVGKVLIVFFFCLIIEIGLLCWSIQLDIVNPKLREFANSQNKSEIKNSSQSIMIGLMFSVLFSALSILLFISTLPTIVVGILLILVALVFTGLRFYFLIQYRNAFFEDIQL